MTDYADFLAGKMYAQTRVGFEPGPVGAALLPHAAAISRWAIRLGRAAIFASTGLTKTRMQLEWARQVAEHAGGGVLIFAPLAVAEQTIREGEAMGLVVTWAEDQPLSPTGVHITNLGKMHRFRPEAWGGVVIDESSILKAITGKTREKLVNDWTAPTYRLCCTATPAPNDMAELANHSEFLGVLTRRDMLAMFFVHDDAGWRLKGHAREAFFRWLATWAVYVRKPSDLGFSDEGFNLPRLTIQESSVEVEHRPMSGQLFPSMAPGIQGRRLARKGSLESRIQRAAEIISSRPGKWLVWCGLNAEADGLTAALAGRAVNIEGADSDEAKIAKERAWRLGDTDVLVTKDSIFGWGMNWQHCHQMLFLGLSDSYESYFQCMRRCYRFGQLHDVDVWIVVSEAEQKAVENVWAKEEEAEATAAEVIAVMGDLERAAVAEGPVLGADTGYATDEASGRGWRLMLGDSCERLKELEAGSVGLSVHSPPFAQLYTYSASDRDMGNCRDYQTFFEHYRFVAQELLRATMPGRRACVHVQQIAMTQVMQGIIAWRDFRAEVVKLYQDAGWIYHGEIVVDKDPQAQAIRTKSKTLLFVQMEKDSSWSIPAMADYILLFRAPGTNAVPIDGKANVSREEWIRWARPVWYGIRETATLQAAAARAERDEKHIAPLQLETVERCIRLWSNAGEIVLDPCAGIGTVPYEAVRLGRIGWGCELKQEYWQQSIRNLREAEARFGGGTLFDLIEATA